MFRWSLVVILLCAAGCSSNAGSIEQITSLPPQSAALTVDATATKIVLPPDTTSTPIVSRDAATSTPLSNNLPLGSAMQIAAATDIAMQPTPRNLIAFDKSPVSILFDEFYDGFSIRYGLVMSDKLVSLDGKQVVMQGYMAPPLKPELDYFVLTRIRLSFCPFCSTAGDWPDDIALVYLGDNTTAATDAPVRLIGRMEVGGAVDPETGMVSLVRIYASSLEILN